MEVHYNPNKFGKTTIDQEYFVQPIEIPQLTLEIALESDLPVYTKALPSLTEIPDGVGTIPDALENGVLEQLDYNEYRVEKDFYLYNVLQGHTLKIRKGNVI